MWDILNDDGNSTVVFTNKLIRIDLPPSCDNCEFCGHGPDGCNDCLNPENYNVDDINDVPSYVYAIVDNKTICDKWKAKNE